MSLGEFLKSKRLESGKSLEQVAASTKIHIKILRAIEEDQYSELPARTFTRGFIVNYAKALKLDSDQILKDQHEFLEQKFSERPNRDQGHQGYAFEGKEIEQNKRWMTIGAGVALLFVVAVLLVFKPQNHKRKEKHKDLEEESSLSATATDETLPQASASPGVPLVLIDPKASPAASSSATASPAATAAASPTGTPAPTSTPKAEPSATPTPKPDPLNKGDQLTPQEAKKKISFQAKEDVWIRYQSDDRPANSLILRKGRFLVIKAKDKIVFETSHPEFLQFKTKGAFADFTGPKNEVDASGALKEYTGAPLGSAPIPLDVPGSKNP